MKEGKTKKERIKNITSIFEEVLPYAEDLKSTWLFTSRKGDKPISKILFIKNLKQYVNTLYVEKKCSPNT